MNAGLIIVLRMTGEDTAGLMTIVRLHTETAPVDLVNTTIVTEETGDTTIMEVEAETMETTALRTETTALLTAIRADTTDLTEMTNVLMEMTNAHTVTTSVLTGRAPSSTAMTTGQGKPIPLPPMATARRAMD
jgi:hypothetical protein